MVADLAGMSVVLLGGTGFLGSHIGRALRAEGARVVPVSRQPAPAGEEGGRVRLDLATASAGSLAAMLAHARADVVVNASGVVWHISFEQLTAVNSAFVGRLTAAVAELAHPPRLIQLGSAYEYGAAPFGSVLTEEHTAEPSTDYGRTKLAGTRTVVRAAHEHAVDGVVLRVAVACGPGVPATSLLGVVARHLVGADAAGEDLVLSPLVAYRDFVDARDVARAVVAAARAPRDAVRGEVVNIGGGSAIAVREAVDLMIRLSGIPVRVRTTGETGGSVRSDVAWLRLDIGKADRLLGWRPQLSFEDSVRDLLSGVRTGVSHGTAPVFGLEVNSG